MKKFFVYFLTGIFLFMNVSCSSDNDYPQDLREKAKKIVIENLGENVYKEIISTKKQSKKKVFEGVCPNTKDPIWEKVFKLDLKTPTLKKEDPISLMYYALILNKNIAGPPVHIDQHFKYIETDESICAAILFTISAQDDLKGGQAVEWVDKNLKKDFFKGYLYIFPEKKQAEITQIVSNDPMADKRKIDFTFIKNEDFNFVCGDVEFMVLWRTNGDIVVTIDIPQGKNASSHTLLNQVVAKAFIDHLKIRFKDNPKLMDYLNFSPKK